MARYTKVSFRRRTPRRIIRFKSIRRAPIRRARRYVRTNRRMYSTIRRRTIRRY